MKHFLRSFLILACALLGAAAPGASAATFHVERATGSGVADSDLAAATELVRSSVGEAGHQPVADASKADYVLKPRLMRLGNSTVMTLEKTKGGEVVYSSQLKAASMDELDRVANRLTRSVIDSVPAREDARVGEVTDEEANQGSQRKSARKGWSLGLGPSLLGGLRASGVGYYFSGAYSWDVNKAAVRVEAETAWRDSAFFSLLSLGANIFFSNRDTTPFVGASFGFGAAKEETGGGLFGGTSTSGFAFGLGGGMVFLRTSSINVELGLRGGILLSSLPSGTPIFGALRLGVSF